MKVMGCWTIAKKTAFCFVCFSDTDRAALCRNRTNCGHDNCSVRHQSLLHHDGGVEQRTNSGRVDGTDEHAAGGTPKSINTIGRESSGPVRLGITPIQVETPPGLVQTVAFLDNGSDTTLVRESFTREHDLEGQTTSLVISTVNGARAVRASQLSLKLAPTSREDTIEVRQAFTIADLPMRAFDNIRSLARRWPHLRDLPFEDFPDTRVDILSSCDVPEGNWVLDQRISHSDPYAMRTMFSWILCGPLGNDGDYSVPINYISRPDNPMGDDLEWIYTHEFRDIADDRVSISREDRAALAIVTETTGHSGTQFEVSLP
ncbi:unnamed protein product [Echinostoma caproni]|uniref:DUF1758 domain-containing protein n=1 Tax=Echinostoma caproni TaxID=27848 RepID=A0A183ATX9_9TREM|nr:unnamed protein product [Echinostoma caproni]